MVHILNIANDKDSKAFDKMIGFYVNDESDAQLMLLSLAEGMSKSALLRKMMVDLPPLERLITEVAMRIYKLYDMKGQPWSRFSVASFKVHVEEELRKKGCGSNIIIKIFIKFNSLYLENKK